MSSALKIIIEALEVAVQLAEAGTALATLLTTTRETVEKMQAEGRDPLPAERLQMRKAIAEALRELNE